MIIDRCSCQSKLNAVCFQCSMFNESCVGFLFNKTQHKTAQHTTSKLIFGLGKDKRIVFPFIFLCISFNFVQISWCNVRSYSLFEYMYSIGPLHKCQKSKSIIKPSSHSLCIQYSGIGFRVHRIMQKYGTKIDVLRRDFDAFVFNDKLFSISFLDIKQCVTKLNALCIQMLALMTNDDNLNVFFYFHLSRFLFLFSFVHFLQASGQMPDRFSSISPIEWTFYCIILFRKGKIKLCHVIRVSKN